MAEPSETNTVELLKPASFDSIWAKIPQEIKDEILKLVFIDVPVTYLGSWREYTKPDRLYLMDCEANRLTGYYLPALFMISKTRFNKAAMTDAIIRHARIRHEDSNRIKYFSKSLTDEHKAITKKVMITDPRLITSTLKDAIGPYSIHLTPTCFRRNGFDRPHQAVLQVPKELLLEKQSEVKTTVPDRPIANQIYQYLEVDKEMKLGKMCPAKLQSIVLCSFLDTTNYDSTPGVPNAEYWLDNTGDVAVAAFKQGVRFTLNTTLTLKTNHLNRFLNGDRCRAVFSTKDWVLRASNGTIALTIPQDLTRKFFVRYFSGNGEKSPEINTYDWKIIHDGIFQRD